MLQIYKKIANALELKIHPATGEAKYKEKLVQECVRLGLDFDVLVEEYSVGEVALEAPSIASVEVKEDTTKVVSDKLKNFSLEDAPDYKDPNEHMKLVRVSITPNDPSKVVAKCEIKTVGNLRGVYTKCIPYNVPTHIPKILYNVFKEAKYQFVLNSIDPKTGKETAEVREAPAYNIEVLEPLTQRELEAIAQEQLARK